MRGPLGADDIRTTEEALAYMVECTLATVTDLAGRARPPKGELSRQMLIAQTGLNHLQGIVVPGRWSGCGYVQEIVESGETVSEWVLRRDGISV